MKGTQPTPLDGEEQPLPIATLLVVTLVGAHVEEKKMFAKEEINEILHLIRQHSIQGPPGPQGPQGIQGLLLLTKGPKVLREPWDSPGALAPQVQWGFKGRSGPCSRKSLFPQNQKHLENLEQKKFYNVFFSLAKMSASRAITSQVKEQGRSSAFSISASYKAQYSFLSSSIFLYFRVKRDGG